MPRSIPGPVYLWLALPIMVLLFGAACLVVPEGSEDVPPEGTPSTEGSNVNTIPHGMVERVDPQAGQMVLVVDRQRTITVEVEESTRIMINGHEGSLEDIHAGDQVEVTIDQETQVATSIIVENEASPAMPDDGTHEDAIVERVDPETRELVVTLETQRTITVQVEESTRITINGREASLEDIQPGDRLKVTIDQETQVVTSITVEDKATPSTPETKTPEAKTPEAKTPEAREGKPEEGTVERVDPETRELVVTLETQRTITVQVEESTRITINGREGSLEDIQPGDRLKVTIDQETQVVTSITVEDKATPSTPETKTPEAKTPEAKTPEAKEGKPEEGTVERADPATRELVVTLETQRTITVQVEESTRIMINGREGSLEEIQPGDRVEVTVDQETQEVTSITLKSAQKMQVTGTITGVDLFSRTMTVRTEDGEELRLRILAIDESTRITIDGTEGTLLDLVRGAIVEVTYNPETMTIVAIHVRTGNN